MKPIEHCHLVLVLLEFLGTRFSLSELFFDCLHLCNIIQDLIRRDSGTIEIVGLTDI